MYTDLMAWLRRVRGPLAALWLCSQIGTIAIIPTALWFDIANIDLTDCTCTHGDHAMCPMHHRSTAPGACTLRGMSDPAITLLASLVGHPGLSPQSKRGPEIDPLVQSSNTDSFSPSLPPVPPDPPPPRA